MLCTKKSLILAAHPDDEVLGCGGTMARLSASGADVRVAFFTDGIGARDAKGEGVRKARQALEQRQDSARSACEILGVAPPIFGGFPDNQMDTISRLEVAQHIEKLIADFEPDTILTHHAGDVNIDHRRVHEAAVIACRPQPGYSVKTVAFFEVASSTEWQMPDSAPGFKPNLFVEISDQLERKEAALMAYDQEMRDWPHARSVAAVHHLACWRGASVGVAAAEAFVLGRGIVPQIV